MKRLLFHAAILLALTLPAWADPAAAGRDGVVLLVNRNVPAGRELALHYAAGRSVPLERIVELDLPATETMSRGEYESRLRDPLLAALRELKLIEQVRRKPDQVAEHASGWSTVRASVRYLVPFFGVPLRVDDTKPWMLEKVANLMDHGLQRDEAAVDSELTLLLQDAVVIRGRVPNPHYNQWRWEPAAVPLLLVARLDGPDPKVVRRMMDDALRVESQGLQGRVLVDQRAPQEDNYRIGDFWLEEASQRLAREGYEVTVEQTDAVFGDLYPADGVAFYLGWYTEEVTGPFRQLGFAFRPGAFAYHNHSGNARSLRTSTSHWTGPLLARGAAVSMGAVSEPFLNFTPHLPILIDRLCRGVTWAEAVYLSLPVLSWQTTVVGDPLYRPFSRSLEEQLRALAGAPGPELDWAHVRWINQLAREGRLNVALRYAREQLRTRESPLVREKLADLYARNELMDDAVLSYQKALDHAPTASFAVRVAARYLTLLQAMGRKEQAQRVDQALRARWAGDPILGALQLVQP